MGREVADLKRYILSRLIQLVFVLLGISVVVFFILHLSGDPVLLMVSPEASAEQIEQLREQMGFNDPLIVQYLRFLGGAVRGDFGESLKYSKPALKLVLQRLPATLILALLGTIFSVIIGIPAGVLSATHRETPLDFIVRTVALLGQAVPAFWLGLMLMLLFSVQLGWLPPFGRGTVAHLVMPVITAGSFSAAAIARLTRSSLLEVMGADFVRTARAKGLAERIVLYKHSLRNALLPVVTMLGMEIGSLIGGAVITETVFSWPGIGSLIVEAIYARDYPLVQAGVFVAASLFVVITLLVDLAYTLLDPRVHYGN